MTPAQANLLRATALLSQVPASGVLRDGVREALAVVDAETARGLNAPRPRAEPNLDTPVDTVVAEVRADLLARSERGIAEYGCTLDRTDLGLREWMEHAYHEGLDRDLYLKRAMRELDRQPAWSARDTAAFLALQAERDQLQAKVDAMANAAPVEPPHAAAPVLAPLAPEPPAAVLGRATEALAWDGQQLPVHVPFNPAVRHPYGDDAYQMTTDGVARMFPNREAAHRWLVAMGKAL